MPKAKLATALSSLHNASQRLEVATELANAVITDVEKKLVDAHVGIEAWLIDPPLKGEGSNTYELGFARIDKVWVLAARRRIKGSTPITPSTPSTPTMVPLARTGREVRAHALELLPLLIAQITGAIEEKATKIEEAVVAYGL